MMKFLSLFLVLALSGHMTLAQSFANRFKSFSKQKAAFVTLKSGETLVGHYQKGKYKKGLYKQIVFEDTVNGKTHTLPAGDIAAMMLVPSDWGRLGSTLESTQTLTRIGNTDLNQLKTDFVYFEQAQLSDKKGTQVLLQKVNPGFDSKISVFDDPWAKETSTLAVGGLDVSGGNLKSYYLIRDGKAVKIAKAGYRKAFDQLYSECPTLEETLPDAKWLDFAKLVAAHEQVCK